MQDTPVTPDVLAELVASVWDTVLGLPIEPLPQPPREHEVPELCACVHINGEWNGAVLLWPTPRFATRAAALLFAIAETEVAPADVQDGLAELCNMLAGNLKSVLPGPSVLSLPTVTRGYQHEVFVRRTKLVSRLAFACGGEILDLQLLQGTIPASREMAPTNGQAHQA